MIKLWSFLFFIFYMNQAVEFIKHLLSCLFAIDFLFKLSQRVGLQILCNYDRRNSTIFDLQHGLLLLTRYGCIDQIEILFIVYIMNCYF